MKADTGTSAGAGPGRRTQKEATRQRVLSAARELFETHGYQGTTIREIARHAGVAVGSVFTTFASKGEILSEVMQARLEPLYAEFDRVLPHLRGTTADRLRTVFAVFFEFESRNLRLFLAHIAAAYDWSRSPAARPFGTAERLRGILLDCLKKGIEDGEVDPALHLDRAVALLTAAYGWTYRLAATEAPETPEQLVAITKLQTELMDEQIGLICAGFHKR